MLDPSLYDGREQTLIKHEILDQYLERFAHIIGFTYPSLTYVDCFSGPWQQQSESFEDTSFGIALNQLRLAREHVQKSKGKKLEIRCFFLEKNPEAFAKLEAFREVNSDVEIRIKNAEFEDSVPSILEFVGERQSTFPFVFVDPTGWKGVSVDTIRPLLALKPGEVLVNFMTSFVRRFIEDSREGTRESLKKLYGREDYLHGFNENESSLDREDWMVGKYCECVAKAGSFDYVSKALILHPNKDSTHYHLVYASRHPKGLEVFKNVEKKAMRVMEERRDSKIEEEILEQGELFPMDIYEPPEPTHYERLRTRYLGAARQEVITLMNQEGSVSYDKLWASLAAYPLSWESDLKLWIREWQSEDEPLIRIEGMRDGQKVPKLRKGNALVLKPGGVLR